MLPFTTITATIFSVTIVLTYLSVRVRLVSIPGALIVGFMVNSLAFFMFAIARDNGLMQALFVAFLQGTIFTVASVTMGAFFRETSRKEARQEVRAVVYSGEQLSTAH
jgi:hypothetical protein